MDLRSERKRLEAALAAGDESVRIALGGVLQLMGEHNLALSVLEPGVDAAAAAGKARQEVEGLIALGVSRQLLGHPDAGITYRNAIVLAGSMLGESDPLTARACWELGSMVHDRDLVERAARIWVACAQPAWSIRARAFYADGPEQRELYVQALAALDLALGDTSPLLIEVLLEAAAAFDAAPARAMRERAVRIARLTAGPASQRHVDALWALATTANDVSVIDTTRDIVRGDDHAEAVILYTKAAFLDLERDEPTPEALLAREESLLRRERGVGSASHVLIPLVSEIKQGWEGLGRLDEAEAFLRRCRDRVGPETWMYRNFTYSIGYLLSGQQRREEYADLWRDFLARREAACPPGSPELIEALEIVATELPHYASAEETIALAERLVRLQPSVAALRALAKAQLAAGRRAEGRATLRQAIERWVAELTPALVEHEPAIAELAENLLNAPDGIDAPADPVSAAFAVYDDALVRATAIAGNHPNLARLVMSRARLAWTKQLLPDDVAFAELSRALGLFEIAEGPEGAGVADACDALFAFLENRDLAAARPYLERVIAIQTARASFEANYSRRRLANVLEQAGHRDDALAIRTRLLEVWAADAPPMLPLEVLAIVRGRTLYEPADATILDGGRNRELDTLEPLCERAHAVVEANPEHGAHPTVTAWFTLARARHDAGDVPGARRALARMVELARFAPALQSVQFYVESVRDELPELHDEIHQQLIAATTVAPAASTTASLADLAAQIVENPMDPGPRLVLADVLTAQGDPRGELIVIHNALDDGGDAGEREQEVIDRHRVELLGLADPDAVTWFLGYFRRLAHDARTHFDPDLLRALLAQPSAAYLSELAIQLAYVEGEYPQQSTNAQEVIAVIAEQPRAALRELSLIQRAVEPDDTLALVDGCAHGEPALWTALPRLRRVHLGGFDVVHAIAHPTLAELVLDDRPICTDGAWELPAVRSLEWSFRGSTTGVAADTDFATLDPLWTRPLPALRELVLRGSFYDCDAPFERPEVCARVATLERLALPASALGDDPIDTLLANAERLRHLNLIVGDLPPEDPRITRLRRELPGCEL